MHAPHTGSLLTKAPSEITSDDEPFAYDWASDPLPDPGTLYLATTSLILTDSQAHMEVYKPHFDLVQLMPTTVFGPNPLAENAAQLRTGSNAMLLDYILGQLTPGELVVTASVHIFDVVAAHVKALDTSVPPGRYILQGDHGMTPWGIAASVLETYFPTFVGPVFVKKPPNIKLVFVILDTGKAERALDFAFRTFSEQVFDTARQYLSLLPMARPVATGAEAGKPFATRPNEDRKAMITRMLMRAATMLLEKAGVPPVGTQWQRNTRSA
ncbi:hypothetical protein GGS20DRAFT_97679 [Poronia punctata]|nr:hypothetical protein GGS20DRAFT_97679 [Poronia punctata]